MKKFIVLYKASTDAMEKMNKQKSPEEMKEGMKPWMDWKNRCGDGMVDLGAPLGNGHKVTADGSSEAAPGVVGYSILQAQDMEAAQKMLEGHPHLGWDAGCDIEIYEAMPLPA